MSGYITKREASRYPSQAIVQYLNETYIYYVSSPINSCNNVPTGRYDAIEQQPKRGSIQPNDSANR